MDYAQLPRQTITIDAASDSGPLECWRHTLGHGGINTKPLSPAAISAVGKLKPRLIRIFIQEFFRICPAPDRYDFSRLDPYMDSMAATGAKVVAAITIKPPCFFPKIDQNIWQPNDIAGYQRLIRALVQRYSVHKNIVTHWEIGNEPDIGEWGGCPYLIKDPIVYADYYQLHALPVLEAFPAAKLGGPALAGMESSYIAPFVAACGQRNLPVDFVSWHLYRDDLALYRDPVNQIRAAIAAASKGPLPEVFITEWNKSFDPISLEELAFQQRRAAIAASAILTMIEAKVEWSFYYHIQDQTAFTADFAPFFANPRIMTEHWNEIPHRFGLFDLDGEVRPQYLLYRMLQQLGETRIAATSDSPSLRILAGKSAGQLAALITNHDPNQPRPAVATAQFSNLMPGHKQLTVYRIPDGKGPNPTNTDLQPSESRLVDTDDKFRFQLHSPADSVALATLTETK